MWKIEQTCLSLYKVKILIILSILFCALFDLGRGQTSPNRHGTSSNTRRNSPDPKDVDWSDLQDLFPIQHERLNLQESAPQNPSSGSSRHEAAGPKPSKPPSRSSRIPKRPFVSPEQKSGERKKRRNQQRRESNALLKIQHPEKYKEKLEKQRMAMVKQRSNMTKEQEIAFKEKRRGWQKKHVEKKFAETGFQSIFRAELHRLRGLEKENKLSTEEREKLTTFRKKQTESANRYNQQKRSKKRARESSSSGKDQ